MTQDDQVDLTPITAFEDKDSADFVFDEKDLMEIQAMLSDNVFGVDDSEEDDEPETKDMDEVLAQAMGSLSVKEQEETIREMYGVAETFKETPDFIEDHLKKFDYAIADIQPKVAYDEAYSRSPEYVRKLRLMALRSQYFDVDKAAMQLVRHFEKKKELFGVDKLSRDIQLRDFDEDEQKCLETGHMQYLPSRDRAGRAVLCIVPTMLPNPNCKMLLRHFWYMTMVVDDEETQKNGCVLVVFNVGPKPVIDSYDFIKQLHRMELSTLGRLAGIHYCYDNPILRPLISVILLVASKKLRARFRPHYGKVMQNKYELYTFGIPDVHVSDDGTCSVEAHLDWLKRRKEQEESGVDNVTIPTKFDVLFGRGKTISTHTGNLRAGHIVAMQRERYEKAGKVQKTQIAIEIVNMIKESNGRFLKQDASGWVEVSDEVARDKVSHFFRKLRSESVKADDESTKKARALKVRSTSPCVESPTADGATSSGQVKRKKSTESLE